MPRNNEAVRFRFQEERVVRLIGALADRPLRAGARVQGVRVRLDTQGAAARITVLEPAVVS